MLQHDLRKRKIDVEYIVCLFVILAVAALLYLRDVGGYSVNKYIFLILLAPPIIFMNDCNMFNLWAFIMPLYVGLPGNYLTLILLVRFFLLWIRNRTAQLSSAPFVLTVLLCMYIVAQNMLMNFTAIYNMIYVIEYIILYFIMTSEQKGNFPEMFLYYSCGIALVGAVMLMDALRYASFAELTSVASRLGYLGRTNEMTIIVDPNYYGLFSIISIAGNWILITRGKYTKGQKLVAIVMVFVALCIGVIGLSRAFIICLAGWSVLILLTERKMTIKFSLLIALALGALLVFALLPDSVEGIMNRFEGDDMSTGNGRTELMIKWLNAWLETPVSMLFGVGLFNCNAHCMQLQFLAGLGVVGFTLIFSLLISYWRMQSRLFARGLNVSAMVPIVVVQVAAATVPIAQSMTFMMPVIMSILIYGEANRR